MIKEWSESTEGGGEREKGREGGCQAEKKGDVTSTRQPIGVREGERESVRPKEGGFLTAASAEGRGAQSISQRRGRKDTSR